MPAGQPTSVLAFRASRRVQVCRLIRSIQLMTPECLRRHCKSTSEQSRRVPANIMPAGDEMSDKLDRLGGTLINAILGALILWVGQTTFRHAGLLAGVDEKLIGVKEQFADVERRHEGIRKWLESAVNDMKDNARSHFTLKDGDKLVAQVRQSELFTTDLERRFAERLGALELKLTALDTRHRDSQEVAALQMELAQLRNELARMAAYAQQVQFQSEDRFARGAPVYLPPVDNRR